MMKILMIAGVVGFVVIAEVGLAYMLIPSTKDVQAWAETHDVSAEGGEAKADAHGEEKKAADGHGHGAEAKDSHGAAKGGHGEAKAGGHGGGHGSAKPAAKPAAHGAERRPRWWRTWCCSAVGMAEAMAADMGHLQVLWH